MMEDDNVDVYRYVRELPSVWDQAVARAVELYSKGITDGTINTDNCGEHACSIVEAVVNKFRLLAEDELVDSETYQGLLRKLLAIPCPLSQPIYHQITSFTLSSSVRCGVNTSS